MDQCYSSVYVGGVCNFPGSVSSQQKIEGADGPVLQLSFIWQANENTSLKHEGKPTQKTGREKRPRLKFGSSFLVFFLLSLTQPHVNWASQEGCFFFCFFNLRF